VGASMGIVQAKIATVSAASNVTRILSKNIFLGDMWQLCCRIHLLQKESAVHQSKPGHILRILGHSIYRETEFGITLNAQI